MTHYVITVELDAPATKDVGDWILDTLHGWHAVAISHPNGNAGAVLTLRAKDLAAAAATACRVIEPTHKIIELSVVDEVTRDHREGLAPMLLE